MPLDGRLSTAPPNSPRHAKQPTLTPSHTDRPRGTPDPSNHRSLLARAEIRAEGGRAPLNGGGSACCNCGVTLSWISAARLSFSLGHKTPKSVVTQERLPTSPTMEPAVSSPKLEPVVDASMAARRGPLLPPTPMTGARARKQGALRATKAGVLPQKEREAAALTRNGHARDDRVQDLNMLHRSLSPASPPPRRRNRVLGLLEFEACRLEQNEPLPRPRRGAAHDLFNGRRAARADAVAACSAHTRGRRQGFGTRQRDARALPGVRRGARGWRMTGPDPEAPAARPTGAAPGIYWKIYWTGGAAYMGPAALRHRPALEARAGVGVRAGVGRTAGREVRGGKGRSKG